MDFIQHLRQHIRPIQDISADCASIVDVPAALFDEYVVCMASYKDVDSKDIPRAYALYTFEGMYFEVCQDFDRVDEWVNTTEEDRSEIVEAFIEDIIPVQHLWKINITMFYNPVWVEILKGIMKENNCEEEFQQTLDRLTILRENAKRQQELADKKQQQIILETEAEIKDLEDSLVQLVDYFESAKFMLDSFYKDKEPAFIRRLQFYCKNLPHTSDPLYQEAKINGLKILKNFKVHGEYVLKTKH